MKTIHKLFPKYRKLKTNKQHKQTWHNNQWSMNEIYKKLNNKGVSLHNTATEYANYIVDLYKIEVLQLDKHICN